MTMTLIDRRELTSAQSGVEFTNIPTDYDDLLVLLSLRSTSTALDLGGIWFNGDTGANYAHRTLGMFGGANSQFSGSNNSYLAQYNNWSIFFQNGSGTTANTFNNVHFYISNYKRTDRHKMITTEGAHESNSNSGGVLLGVGLWRSNAAINSVIFNAYSGSWTQYSSASLYGITRGSDGITQVS